MAEDVFINKSLDTEWDEVGDIRTVYDEDGDARQIRQSISISVIEEVGLDAPSLIDEAIEEYRGDIEAAIANNPMSEPPYDVIVTDVDYDGESITFEATTSRVSVPFTLD
jgi:hypothetical protein